MARSEKDAEVDRHVGGRIRTIREGKQVSQETLAIAVGKTVKDIAGYESGDERVSNEVLEAIADYLGVRMSEFFRGFMCS